MSKRIARVPKRAAILMKNLNLLETKQRGDIGEVVFLERVLCLGYTCSKPYGDSARYDWVVGGAARRLKRVQVKTAFTLNRYQNFYSVPTFRATGKRYKRGGYDLLAVYIAPEDVWYIIPAAVFFPRARLYFRPYPIAQDRWRRYREAWWRLGRIARPAAQSRPVTAAALNTQAQQPSPAPLAGTRPLLRAARC